MHQLLVEQLAMLNDSASAPISRLSNMLAAIYWSDPAISWAGIYYIDDQGNALLGPFQGKPACMTISPGKGVIQSAVEKRASLLVDDVCSFPGHIACDPASRSEVVLPLFDRSGNLKAVLDIDSDQPAHFQDSDLTWLEAAAAILQESAFCVTL